MNALSLKEFTAVCDSLTFFPMDARVFAVGLTTAY